MLLKIQQDIEPISPRTFDNLGTISLIGTSNLEGDENFDDFSGFLCDKLGLDLDLICDRLEMYSDDKHVIDYLLSRFEKEYIYLPVYMLDHSGITLRTTPFSCPWDAGMVGIIYVSKETIRKEYNKTRISQKLKKQIKTYLEGEIGTYYQWVTGNVYGYILETVEGEELDSCWGFYNSGDILSHIDPDLIDQIETIDIQGVWYSSDKETFTKDITLFYP